MNEDEFYKNFKKIGDVEIVDTTEEINTGYDWIVLDGQLFSRKWED